MLGNYIVIGMLLIIGSMLVVPISVRLAKDAYWRLAAGATVTLPWPRKYWLDLGGGMSVHSDEPNDHYRPWLEANVGRQGWDWRWDYHHLSATEAVVILTVRKGKAPLASAAALKWSY